MAKKRKCRYTPEELEIHEEAVKLRKLTDKQLVMAFRDAPATSRGVSEDNIANDKSGVKTLLEGLSRGECKGVKGATVFKISEYAAEMGLI